MSHAHLGITYASCAHDNMHTMWASPAYHAEVLYKLQIFQTFLVFSINIHFSNVVVVVII